VARHSKPGVRLKEERFAAVIDGQQVGTADRDGRKEVALPRWQWTSTRRG
jgi:hypothetical protein